MLISQISQTLNDRINQNGGLLSKIQDYRTRALGQKFRHNTLFGKGAIHDEEGYGYHHGGRKELQYNIGHVDLKDDVKKFYYGVAMSFELSREVPDPLVFFERHTQRLNEIIRNNPEVFGGLQMWHLSGTIKKGNRQINGPYPVQEISSPNLNDFYVIGQIIEPPSGPDDPAFQKITQVFERLFPVYWAVTFEEGEVLQLENRLARVCYNTKQWKRPSGPEGKSNYSKSYERDKGYGHEEWLFDTEKSVDGWHYSYLRPVDMFWDTYVGRTFDVKLYTRSLENNYEFIGEIKNLEVIGRNEAERVTKIYGEKGWLNEMMNQVNNASGTITTELENLFNVRFKPQDGQLYSQPIIAKEGEIPFGRYIFYKEENIRVIHDKPDFTPNLPDPQKSEAATLAEIKRTIEQQVTFREDYHTAIQIGLHLYLEDLFPKSTRREAAVQNGNQSIDLKFKLTNDKFILFEIKTYENLRTCFRTALGQLLEYAYRDGYGAVGQLVIVSQHTCKDQDIAYLQFLRDVLHLPLGYLCFDWKNKTITQALHCDFLDPE